MIGQHLLRLAYRRRPSKDSFLYRDAVKHISKVRGDILDMGGGPGYIYNFLGGNRYYVVLDIDYKLLSYGDDNIDKVLAMAEEKVLRDKSFDVVIIHDALHHFKDVDKALSNSIGIAREKIFIFEIEAGKISGKIIKMFEKLLGFPGNFISSDELYRKVGRFKCIKVKMEKLDGLRYLIKIVRIPSCNSEALFSQ